MVAGCDTVPKPGFEDSPSLFEQLVKTETTHQLPQPAGYRPDHGPQHPSEAGKYRSYPGQENAFGQTSLTRQMATARSGQGNGYKLSFNNVELAELTKVILRDTLKETYVFDTKDPRHRQRLDRRLGLARGTAHHP